MRVTQMSAFENKAQSFSAPIAAQRPLHSYSREKSFLNNSLGKLLSSFEKDDYILAVIILVLVFEGCDDYILLALLGYLFIVGI